MSTFVDAWRRTGATLITIALVAKECVTCVLEIYQIKAESGRTIQRISFKERIELMEIDTLQMTLSWHVCLFLEHSLMPCEFRLWRKNDKDNHSGYRRWSHLSGSHNQAEYFVCQLHRHGPSCQCGLKSPSQNAQTYKRKHIPLVHHDSVDWASCRRHSVQ